MIKQNTHLELDENINGKLLELKKDYSKLSLLTKEFMRADKQGLVHGGFIFCVADKAAMCAINDPFVVLSKSENKFLAPIKVGDELIFEAKVIENNGSKSLVEVVGYKKEKKVFIGTFYTVILKKHIFDL